MGCWGQILVWKPGYPRRGKESTRGVQPLLEKGSMPRGWEDGRGVGKTGPRVGAGGRLGVQSRPLGPGE